ncbi:MAG: transcriptional repressor NrdR [Gaiellales bacterium]|jgi:transcriptional repressor NrdR|nr:transcriptional repressor NrdR [Gaiellales bacterium]MDX6593873.1 transcriptional repressor NrdR [Gaiellales bacterium]
MHCPFCEHGDTKVVDSRVAGKGAIRRRRECLLCSQRFTSFERIEESPLFVIKRDGARQPFDRTKLMAGLIRACTKRPVSLEEIERTAATIEAGLRNGIRDEVPSEAIGEEALGVLRHLDKVAYVRFASVYRDFQDIEEFEQELARMEHAEANKRSVIG